jgi:Ca2+/Na+ antiporter
MSFSERAILWLHIGVAIFTIGPVTVAIMATPRYIRQRNAVVVGYLYRVTRLYTIVSILVLIFGIILADMLNVLSKPWLSISMTLFVVALVLLILILRDQRKAVTALEGAATSAPAVTTTTVAIPAETPEPDGDAEDGDALADDPFEPESEKIAAVERGRIASLGGVTGLIWLVILILMVWR